MLAGIAGLRYCRSSLLLSDRLAWVIFFTGVVEKVGGNKTGRYVLKNS